MTFRPFKNNGIVHENQPALGAPRVETFSKRVYFFFDNRETFVRTTYPCTLATETETCKTYVRCEIERRSHIVIGIPSEWRPS